MTEVDDFVRAGLNLSHYLGLYADAREIEDVDSMTKWHNRILNEFSAAHATTKAAGERAAQLAVLERVKRTFYEDGYDNVEADIDAEIAALQQEGELITPRLG